MRCAAVWLALLAAGCAALPTRFERHPGHAIPPDAQTILGRRCADATAHHVGESGFVVLDDGRQSMTTRLALVSAAERSIDIQSFIWAGDTVGRVLWDSIRRAADRGVRVRILVDDMELGG